MKCAKFRSVPKTVHFQIYRTTLLLYYTVPHIETSYKIAHFSALRKDLTTKWLLEYRACVWEQTLVLGIIHVNTPSLVKEAFRCAVTTLQFVTHIMTSCRLVGLVLEATLFSELGIEEYYTRMI
jgi:hypothetical protein